MFDLKLCLDNISERKLLGEFLKVFTPPIRMSTKNWAEKHRYLTPDVSSRPGKMDCMRTPWMLYVMECLDNPAIKTIVGKKSAQIAWTETINNYIGKLIHIEPKNIMIVFPRAKSAQKFYKEKLKPYLESTKVLKEVVGSLAKVSHTHIPFLNGFLMLANLGSAEDGKSSVISVVIVEEPDGIKSNVNNQGDGLAITQQRMKSHIDSKLVYAGTPTDLVFSQVVIAYDASNRMVYMVPCHVCKESHCMSFENLKCDPFQDKFIHELYGVSNPETAYYECPDCKAIWSFEQKNKNVLEALKHFNKGWYVTRPEVTDIYGFAFNELLSNFEKSSFIELAKQKLRAERSYEKGNEGLLRSFVNNSMGEGYQAKQSGFDIEEFKEARLNYPEYIVPMEGLKLTAGIDVQHNRFAIVVRAWGRNGNSWLVYWGEIFGDVLDWDDNIWEKLTEFMFQDWEHAAGNGITLKIDGITIDSADGSTTELVYRWALRMFDLGHPHIFCSKGRGEGKNTECEIYNEPGYMEVITPSTTRKTLAETMGVNVFVIGAHRAHAEVLRRFNLKGKKDRHYHNETSYGGYEEQILSCVKTFSEGLNKGAYKKKASASKEGIDCEKMALHAMFALQIRNYTEKHWAEIENYLYSKGFANG